MKFNLIANRSFCTNNVIKPKICVVGAGPAGFYAAQHLIKKLDNVQVDILEKLPVPFGLVRFGVAPDHPEVKNVINTFTKTAEHPKVNFYGNISLGRDVSLKELRHFYNVVLLTYGAEESRKLNIPGENLDNVLPARSIVGWYNGLPWDSNLKIDLSGEKVAIFGQGNVAIDVARILLSPVELLKTTDITQFALEALVSSKIREVHLIGRRGPLQAAFTIKELREMIKLPGCETIWCSKDFEGVEPILPQLARPRKRLTELMLTSLKQSSSSSKKKKKFIPVFYKSPLEIIGSGNVEKVVLGRNRLVGDDLLRKNAVLTDNREELSCNLAVTSIGYKSIQVDKDIPFDKENGLVRNINGKVDNGLYASGWLSTGPTGVILTTMSDAFNTAGDIVRDLKCDDIKYEAKEGFEGVKKVLESRNVQIVKWEDWIKIDKYEQEEGKKFGKPREKVVDIKKMLELAA